MTRLMEPATRDVVTTASDPLTPPASKTALWTGRVISTLVVLMLLMSSFFKFKPPEFAVKENERLGWSMGLAPTLGILEVAVVVVYAIPQTAVLGAILLTGYLGGATATHVRVGDPFFMPVILGVLAWVGLYLRDPRLRPLAPWRRLQRSA